MGKTLASYAFQSLTKLVGTGRKISVKISRFFLAVLFQRSMVFWARGSATMSSSCVPISFSFGVGAGRMNEVGISVRLWLSCGGISPRCSVQVVELAMQRKILFDNMNLWIACDAELPQNGMPYTDGHPSWKAPCHCLPPRVRSQSHHHPDIGAFSSLVRPRSTNI